MTTESPDLALIRAALKAAHDTPAGERRRRDFLLELHTLTLLTGALEITNALGDLIGLRRITAEEMKELIEEPDVGVITSAYGPEEAGDLSDIVGHSPENEPVRQ
jgi:hypothetical protein